MESRRSFIGHRMSFPHPLPLCDYPYEVLGSLPTPCQTETRKAQAEEGQGAGFRDLMAFESDFTHEYPRARPVELQG